MFLPFIIHIPLLLFLAVYFKRKFPGSELNNYYWPSLLLKILAGLVIGLLYKYYYTYGGDTYLYFRSSGYLTDLLLTHPKQYLEVLAGDEMTETLKQDLEVWQQPRALFFCKILSLINLVTFSSYWITAAYLSLFSFLGLWYLGNYLLKRYKLAPFEVVLAFFFLPSFVLWSSGLLKESVVVGCICLTVYLFLQWIDNKKFSFPALLLFLLFTAAGAGIKFYFFLVLLPVMAGWSLIHFLPPASPLEQKPWASLLIPLLLILFSAVPLLMLPSLLQYFLKIIYISYTHILQASGPSGTFTFNDFSPSLSSLIRNFPLAIITGLFRPFVWEAWTFPALVVGMENLLLSLLVAAQAFRHVRQKNLKLPPVVVAALTYIIVMAALMAFIAPNWGTLSRYKTGYLMFFTLLVVHRNPFLEFIARKFNRVKTVQQTENEK